MQYKKSLLIISNREVFSLINSCNKLISTLFFIAFIVQIYCTNVKGTKNLNIVQNHTPFLIENKTSIPWYHSTCTGPLKSRREEKQKQSVGPPNKNIFYEPSQIFSSVEKCLRAIKLQIVTYRTNGCGKSARHQAPLRHC